MSNGIHLVCHETKQAVHVAEVSSSWYRGPDYAAIVGAFCHAHAGRSLVTTLGFGDDAEFSEYEKWTPENVEENFKAMMTDSALHLPHILARVKTGWR
ncbi:conserved hypothetical protein [Paraburkholderia tropica]|uniref:hypothetical protein n=1 Tax=Paraburkholderia tropica TaxID=92647 RepID=UPI001CAD333C|nr:hypothetical protein [Paraburkholderia tropica]CAG9235579.1 conserved hypothetical protein [Paraburkholderia tropica]